MPIINRSIPDFSVQAFHNGEFKTVTSDSVKGKWSIFLFYPADFTFVCPTELEDNDAEVFFHFGDAKREGGL